VGDIGGLVEAARAGDGEAWGELVTRFEDFAVAVALRWVADRESALDVAQEAFVLAFCSLDQLRDSDAFAGWFSMLIRTARSRHARRQSPVAIDRTAAMSVPDPGDDPVAVAISGEQGQSVRAAVEALPEHERAVIALHYLADLSYEQIAGVLEISPSAARKRAFSARRRLKKLMLMPPQAIADCGLHGRMNCAKPLCCCRDPPS